jgi:hypothetical protein
MTSTGTSSTNAFFNRVLESNSLARGEINQILCLQNPQGVAALTSLQKEKPPHFRFNDFKEWVENNLNQDTKWLHIHEKKACTLRDLLPLLEESHPKNFSLRELDTFNSLDTLAAFHLHSLLYNAGPNVVHEKFGLDAVIWVCANMPDPKFFEKEFELKNKKHDPTSFSQEDWKDTLKRQTKKYSNYFCSLEEIDRLAARKAIGVVSRWLDDQHSYRGLTLLRNYSLLDLQQKTLKDTSINSADAFNLGISLHTLFANQYYHSRDETGRSNFSEKRLKDLSFSLCTPKDGNDFGDAGSISKLLEDVPVTKSKTGKMNKKISSAFMDAPLAITLNFKGEPQAVISFLVSDPLTITIVQIQGVVARRFDEEILESGKKNYVESPEDQTGSRGLIGLRWHRLLVRAVEHIAESHGFKHIQILRGRDNPWLGSEKGALPFDSKKAAMYDKVAEGMGYSPGRSAHTLSLGPAKRGTTRSKFLEKEKAATIIL